MSNGYTSIEQYPPLQIGKVALAPGPTGYLYIPVEPGGLVPAVTPPPETVEGYPVFTTMGVAIAPDGGVWQYQPTQPGGITEVIPSLSVPTNVTPPSIAYVTGSPAGTVGAIYSMNAGTWTPSTPMPVYTRQWLRNGTPIAGATGTTYTIATADIGTTVNGYVIATNPAGSSAPVQSSNSVGPIVGPPVNTVAPVITIASGSGYVVSAILDCSAGTWNPTGTRTNQWMRGGTPIGGATGVSYLVATADIGAMLTCVVTMTGTGGAASATSNAVGPISASEEDPELARLDDNGAPEPKPRAKPKATTKRKR